MKKGLTVNIKMYRVEELGDCFLLTFQKEDRKCKVLIDCGSFRNGEKSKNRIAEVVTHIKETTGGELDVVVGTHQHNDHLSGFTHCEEEFMKMDIGQVWLSWLDDPKDPGSRKVKEAQKKLTDVLFKIHNQLENVEDKALAGNLRMEINDIMGFYFSSDGTGDLSGIFAAGTIPKVPEDAIKVLKKMGNQQPKYLSPGDILQLPNMESEVKVYVLGPPKDNDLLFDIHANSKESYDPRLMAASQQAEKFLSALQNIEKDYWEEVHFPFTDHFKWMHQELAELSEEKKKKKENSVVLDAQRRYDTIETWRRIDSDWLAQAGRLALYLDSYTNNTSLVLAFEMVRTGKVLLFVGDAQTGNWLSWKDIKWGDKMPNGFKTFDLLANTILYKVGHHASHNATLVEGLESMTHPELIALIPVDKNDPNIKKENGWKMPAKNLYKNLKQKTKYRVLRMDKGFADECKPGDANAKWDETGATVNIDDLYVECHLKI